MIIRGRCLTERIEGRSWLLIRRSKVHGWRLCLYRLGLRIHVATVEQVHQVGYLLLLHWGCFGLALAKVEVKIVFLLFLLFAGDGVEIEVIDIVAANISRLVSGKLLKIRPKVHIILIIVLLGLGHSRLPLLLSCLLGELNGSLQISILISPEVVPDRCRALGLASPFLWLVREVALEVVSRAPLVHQMVKRLVVYAQLVSVTVLHDGEAITPD